MSDFPCNCLTVVLVTAQVRWVRDGRIGLSSRPRGSNGALEMSFGMIRARIAEDHSYDRRSQLRAAGRARGEDARARRRMGSKPRC